MIIYLMWGKGTSSKLVTGRRALLAWNSLEVRATREEVPDAVFNCLKQ
jgi:hypothetical protein